MIPVAEVRKGRFYKVSGRGLFYCHARGAGVLGFLEMASIGNMHKGKILTNKTYGKTFEIGIIYRKPQIAYAFA
jgi:hypothetical protein